jgi:TonB-dependent starch-binding outer membrane protein SusC
MRGRLRQFLGIAGVLATLPAVALAQGAGTISGTVTDRASRQPVADAQVIIIGSTRGARTNEAGTYRLGGVPAGRVALRVLRIGYEAQVETVTVAAGQTATADFQLGQTATRLDQVVISATGEQERRRETGNTVATIAVDSIPKTVVNDVSDLLSSRASGVVVTQVSGTTGGGSRIRIRGSNSVSLTNEPLVMIDGIRMNQDPGGSTIGIGGQNPTRIDDLNPEDIENIEVIKGPAAAALYGTAAANGVIQITTKRGKSGKTRWNAYADGGQLTEVTDFPANYQRIGTRANGTGRVSTCFLVLQAAGGCAPKPDSLLSFNPLEVNSPFKDGWREQFGLNASGGTDLVQYYVGGDYNREQGVYVNNRVQRINMRTNLNGQLGNNIDLGVRAGYNQVRLNLPQNDNNDQGPLGNGLLGNAEDDPTNHGYLFWGPEVFDNIITTQNVDRLTGSADARWRPLGWLTVSGVAGIDYAGRADRSITPPELIPAPDRRNIGNAASNPYSLYTYTTNLTGTANYALRPTIQTSTSVGTQYTNEVVKGTQAFGEGLAGGTGSLAGTTSGFAVAEQNTQVVTIGGFVQEKVQWRDKVFLTGAVRGDDNSAFGADLGFVYYPSASLSWVIGEESFFPKNDWVSSLRLRTSYGESGQRPGFRNAVTFYTAVSVKDQGQDVGAAAIGSPVGNADLKPERSKETEFGFDAGFFRDRANLELTYYSKKTTDALISRNLPPSSGAALRFENLGEVTNKGWEATLNATLLSMRNVQWDATLNGSTTKNKLVRLGKDIDTIFFGLGSNSGEFIQRHAEGFPLGGYWQRPFTGFHDDNDDGIIGIDEVDVGDNPVYLGQPLPTRELNIQSGVTLFKWIRLAGLLDYRGGFKVYNATGQFRCAAFFNCQAANDPSTPLAEQARAAASAAAIFGENSTDAGYVEDGTFWKLREVSLTFTAPRSWAQRTGAAGLSLTLAGRNLGTWTDYTGFDPEINFNGTSNFSTAEFLTQPNVRYFTARFNVNW